MKLQRGQTISFRVPSDTPDHIIETVTKIKGKRKKKFFEQNSGICHAKVSTIPM